MLNILRIISIHLGRQRNDACRSILINHTSISSSTLFFREGQFTLNRGQILFLRSFHSKRNISMIGPIIIENNWSLTKNHKDFFVFQNMAVHIHGPVTISRNNVERKSILWYITSEVLFYDNIIFKFNSCKQTIFLNFQYVYIKIMEYTNITFINNKCNNKLIEIMKDNDFRNDFCLFQYMTSSNKSMVSPNNYAINVINTLETSHKKCSFMYHHFIPNCQWLPSAAFQNYNTETINHQIIHIDDQQLNYRMICLCYDNGTYDCRRNVFGPVYP